MITEIRKTISGTEYWDTKEKRSLFVPTGEEPGFKVTKNPKSMIAKFADNKVLDVKVDELSLDDMTVKELRDHAASINVEILADIKKKEDIMKYCAEQGCKTLIDKGRYCLNHKRKQKKTVVYSKNRSFYRTKAWQDLKSFCYQRDKGLCQRCGRFNLCYWCRFITAY